MSVDVVMVGNLLVDDIVFDDGTTRMAQAGGALLHAALACAAWGVRVGCVSVVGNDYPRPALTALRARGVALDGVRSLDAPGLRVWLLHEDGQRHMVGRLGRPSHDAVSPMPHDIPATWRDAACLHIAPMPFARQQAMAETWGEGSRFVALDPHMPLRDDTLDRWRPVLARADALFASDDELHLDGAPRDVLRALAVGRMRYVVHKQGARGGVLYDARTDALLRWEPITTRVVDVTGAGDAFAAGFLTALRDGGDVTAAIARGAASSSVAIEGRGVEALVATTREELDARASRCIVHRVAGAT